MVENKRITLGNARFLTEEKKGYGFLLDDHVTVELEVTESEARIALLVGGEVQAERVLLPRYQSFLLADPARRRGLGSLFRWLGWLRLWCVAC